MSNLIQDKILALAPAATVKEGEVLTVTVPAENFHAVAQMLRDDKEMQFDCLVCVTGADWGETVGVVYHLRSTVLGHEVVLRQQTADRENPVLPTVSDLWHSANLNEREVFDYFGIRFAGHPDMRRLFLRNDWKGYPLRKDYDANPELNPVPTTNEEPEDETTEIEFKDGKLEVSDHQLFDEKEYVVNIGPQHPATHGVLRLCTSIEGEIIKKIDVHCGYIHRGIEKMCESMTYPQTLAMTDRFDYLGAHQNRHALCMCIEKAMGLEVPERAQYIRTIMDELQRIDSHLLFYSCLCMDMGGLTPFFYGMRDREKVLDIFEGTTGGRLIQNYNVIGGVMADIDPDFVKKVKDFIAYLPGALKDYHDVFTGNVIAQQRMKGIGILSKEDAISFGATGPTGRASGWACDVRKVHPYGVYDKVDFKEILRTEGDSFARYMVRMEEILEAVHIIEQLIDNIPEGDYAAKTKPIIRLPEGEYYASTEASRGEFGVYIESRGDKYPYRMKFRSSCMPLVSVVDTLARGSKIGDLIVIGATLDYVIPDVDR